ncbi:MAG: DoxX family protein [Planctomycetota bacterium]
MPNNETLTSVGLLVLRVGAGVYMITHGWGKAGMLFSGEFDGFPDPMGIGSTMSLIGAVFSEVVCAALVVVGLFTRVAAIPVVFTMVVAAFIVHGGDPWVMGSGKSKEPAMLYLIMYAAIACLGAGAYSIDGMLRGKRGG